MWQVLVLAFFQPLLFAADLPADSGRPPRADSRLSIPDPAAVDAADKVISEAFRGEFLDPLPAHRLLLARKLLMVSQTAHEKPATIYAELLRVRDIAVSNGNLDLAFEAVDEIGATFRVDNIESKADLAYRGGLPVNERTVEALVGLSREATEKSRLNTAERSASLALSIASRIGKTEALLYAREQVRNVAEERREARQADGAQKRLQQNPKDSEAALVVGTRLTKLGHWKEALVLLAQCSDPRVRSVAIEDLQSPKTPSESKRLGDSWWDLGESDRSFPRASARTRAAACYRAIFPELSGVEKTRVGDRMIQAATGTEGDASSYTNQWLTLCWDGSHWMPYPATKMTLMRRNGRLYVTNTSGIHTAAFFVLDCPLEGAFNLSLKVKGACVVSLEAANHADSNIGISVAGDDEWHNVRLERRGDRILATRDAIAVDVQRYNTDGSLNGYAGVLVKAGETVAMTSVDLH